MSFCPPCGRPGRACRASRCPAFAFAAGPSWLGGCEESGESRPACRRSAATSARSDSISVACSATTSSSSATRAASSSYDGCSGCGIPEPNHDHKPDASTNTPQINRGPDWLLDARCEKAGVRRIRVHDTRHTCGSLLAALDVHPRVAMAILRHAQISITMEIYTEVPDEVTRAALKRLGQSLGSDDTKPDPPNTDG